MIDGCSDSLYTVCTILHQEPCVKDWGMKLAIVDILWESFVYAISAYLSGII